MEIKHSELSKPLVGNLDGFLLELVLLTFHPVVDDTLVIHAGPLWNHFETNGPKERSIRITTKINISIRQIFPQPLILPNNGPYIRYGKLLIVLRYAWWYFDLALIQILLIILNDILHELQFDLLVFRETYVHCITYKMTKKWIDKGPVRNEYQMKILTFQTQVLIQIIFVSYLLRDFLLDSQPRVVVCCHLGVLEIIEIYLM